MNSHSEQKHVKIYGTLGPACREPALLAAMLAEGLDGMRLNLSHATLAESADVIEAFHQAADGYGLHPELLIDLMGPELRVGRLSEPLSLRPAEAIDADALPFPDVVRNILRASIPDRDILLDDGKILLRTEVDHRLRVVRGGVLESRKSVALPGYSIPSPALTKADKANLKQARSFGVTGVMQPFVRSAKDLLAVREAIGTGGTPLRLFAKIENADGIAHLSELIPHCDEIIIARGDLGNAMPLWELPAAQKRIAKACRDANRDFMVVTQMLDSMMHRAVPTRAEVSDIFNAVLDGASSVMVTGETASGEYPVEAIRYLVRTVREAEAYRNANLS